MSDTNKGTHKQSKDNRNHEQGQPSAGKSTQRSSSLKITKERVDVMSKRANDVVKFYDDQINILKGQMQQLVDQIDNLKRQMQKLEGKLDGIAVDAALLTDEQKKWEWKKTQMDDILYIFETRKGRKESPTEREQNAIEERYGIVKKALDDVAKELELTFSA